MLIPNKISKMCHHPCKHNRRLNFYTCLKWFPLTLRNFYGSVEKVGALVGAVYLLINFFESNRIHNNNNNDLITYVCRCN